MTLLVTAVVSGMVSLRGLYLTILLGTTIVQAGIKGLTDAELLLSWLAGIRTQVGIMTLLVTTVVSGMISFRVLLYKLLTRERGVEVIVERWSLSLIQKAAAKLLCRLIGVRTQVGIMALLISTVVCCVIILRALEAGELVGALELLITGLILGLNCTNRLVSVFQSAILGYHVPGTCLGLKAILLKVLIHNKNPP